MGILGAEVAWVVFASFPFLFLFFSIGMGIIPVDFGNWGFA